MKIVFGHIIGATEEEYHKTLHTLQEVFAGHPQLKDTTLIFTPRELKFYDKDEIINALTQNGENSCK